MAVTVAAYAVVSHGPNDRPRLRPGRVRREVGFVGFARLGAEHQELEVIHRATLGRLHARDLISVHNDRVHLRPDGRRLLRKTRGGRGFIPQWKRLEAAFEAAPLQHVPTQPLLSAGAFDRALDEYLKRAGLA